MREAPSFKNNLLSTDACYHIKVLQVTITANLCLVVIMLPTVWCPHTCSSMYFKTHVPPHQLGGLGWKQTYQGTMTHTQALAEIYLFILFILRVHMTFFPSFSKQKCMLITKEAVYFHLHFISLLKLKLSFAVELIQSTHCRGRVRVNSF